MSLVRVRVHGRRHHVRLFAPPIMSVNPGASPAITSHRGHGGVHHGPFGK
jgi:hypothetical protein